MNKEKIIQELIEFAEGRMDFDTFWNNYKNNQDYKKLFEVKLGERFGCFRNKTVNEHLLIFNPNSYRGKTIIHNDVCRYLEFYGYAFNKYQKYQNDLQFLCDIQPSYVYIEDEEFLNNIINQAPKELSKTKKKLWIKNKIKEMFKYDTKPPRWIQDPEWPIIDGKPLIFKSQTKEKLDDERVYYTFYNPETKEEQIVCQFY